MKATTQGATFAVTFAGMLFFGASIVTLGSLAIHLQQRHGLDSIGSGALFSVLPLGLLGGSVVFGPVADRFGYRWLLVAACMAMCAGFEGISFAREVWLLKASVLVIGFGGGIINGATSALVADISGQHKGPNLSLLGVFFGLGALGMPLLLGLLSKYFEPFALVATVGALLLATGVLFGIVRYPPPKVHAATGPVPWHRLLEATLVLTAFFLLCQSSFESLISNWTTTYFHELGPLNEQQALYALSMHMAGMAAMRLLMGTALRHISQTRLMWVCLGMLPAGILLLAFGGGIVSAMAGMVLLGAGLAGGFPIMLGLLGARYVAISGTAFSTVLVVALAGNMLINYLMGLVSQYYGPQYLTAVCLALCVTMLVLCLLIFKRHKNTNNQ
jgi:fucose permease